MRRLLLGLEEAMKMGNFESGEFTASGNHYKFSIPVSAKKSHVVVYPKKLGTIIADPTAESYIARRICTFLGIEGEGLMEVSIMDVYASNTCMNKGDCYWYGVGGTGYVTFNENSIDFNVSYAPFALGVEYEWFAW